MWLMCCVKHVVLREEGIAVGKEFGRRSSEGPAAEQSMQ